MHQSVRNIRSESRLGAVILPPTDIKANVHHTQATGRALFFFSLFFLNFIMNFLILVFNFLFYYIFLIFIIYFLILLFSFNFII